MEPGAAPRVVILDNYDSYVFNLYQRLGELTGTHAVVLRNDRTTVEAIAALRPTHLVISPGPGSPEAPGYFGVCREALLAFGPRLPVLGVCLGHQGVAAAFGARVVRAARVMHGKTSPVRHDGSPLFAGVDSPFTAMRYHSLVVEPSSVPPCLAVTAWTDDGGVMALQHREHPILGVQFHPESIGTPAGYRILQNFLDWGRPFRPLPPGRGGAATL